MSSRWPTDLADDGTAPPNLMVVSSGDPHLMRQAMYQLQAATQLQDRGFTIDSFQRPVVGKMIRITIPIVAAAADGTRHAIYTQCEDWTSERIEDLRYWIADLREESDLGVIVASRLPLPDAASAPEVAQWLHLPYDTLNTPAPPPAATATEEPVLPCLKEAKWQGRADTVCRALWEKQSSFYMPWVAIGYDRPHTFEFISTKNLAELNTTEEALHARALVALRARPAKWQPLELDVKGTPLKMLVCTGDYFSAEHILDPAFMQEAQRILKAPGLLVGVPRRGFLMATTAGGSDQLLLAFGAGVAGQYSRGESPLITPMLFVMKDGVIIDIVEAVAEKVVPDGEPKGKPASEKIEGDPDEPYVSAIISRNDRGTEDVHLMAGGKNGDRLAKAIDQGFQALLKEHLRRPEFSGHIHIVVLGNTPPEARKHIPSVLEHLRGVCNDLSKGKEKRYRVSLEYQKDSLSSAPASPSSAPADRPAARPRAATSSLPRASSLPPRASSPAPQSGPSFFTRFKWRVAGAIAAAVVAWVIYGRGGSVSYPASVTYDGDSLPQATKWARNGISAAVYVPAGERMPAASRQLGVLVSSQHQDATSLLQWVQLQSQQGSSQIHHDAVDNNERCHVGITFLENGVRPYLSLQLFRTVGSGSASIELDDELDDGTLSSCLNRGGCFDEVCEERWQKERGALTRTLTSVVGQ